MLMHKTFDQPRPPLRYGSVKEGKVNPDLQEERDRKDFDQLELTKLIYGEQYNNHLNYVEWFKKHPEVFPGPKFYDMTREE